MTLILDMPCQDNAASFLVDDVSVSNNDGVLQNEFSQAYSVTGGPGGSLTRALDGASMGAVGDAALWGTPITFTSTDVGGIGVFAKSNSAADFNPVLGNGDPSRIGFDGSGNFEVNDSNGSSSTIAVTGQTAWHHYFANLNANGSMVLYQDAVLIGTLSGGRTGDISLQNIGNEQAGGNWFIGKFCGIRIYDTTRTQPQIAADALIGGIGGSTPRASYMTLLGVS